MYNTKSTRYSAFPLDKKNEKWYSESVRTQLNMAAFDNDDVADSAVDYLYDKKNQSKTQSFLRNNGFPSAQDREFGKELLGVQEERKNILNEFKNKVKAAVPLERYDESDRAFMQGLLGDEEGEREYQKRVAGVNAQNAQNIRKQNELINAFKGSPFESLLKPSTSYSAYEERFKNVQDSVRSAPAQGEYLSVLQPTLAYNVSKQPENNTFSSDVTKSGYNGNESLYAYSGNKSASQIKTSEKIWEPGYNKKGVWSENPDADNYGTNSAKYKMLATLDNAYLNTTDEKQKEKYKKAANMIRDHHTNVDSTNFTKVLLLNNETAAWEKGHNAIMLLNDKNEGVFFSFYPEGGSYPAANGQMRFRLLTSNQVNTFKTTGNVFDATAVGSRSAVKRHEAYTRYIEIPISTMQGTNIMNKGFEYITDPNTYLLVGNQCDNVASQIMRAGGKGYFVDFNPNFSFEGVCEDWRLPIRNI